MRHLVARDGGGVLPQRLEALQGCLVQLLLLHVEVEPQHLPAQAIDMSPLRLVVGVYVMCELHGWSVARFGVE